MFQDEVMVIEKAARIKADLLKYNPVGYFIAAMLAGMYVGFGILLIFTVGGSLNGAPYAKILMGAAFGIALSLVVIAGSELFTGNNMVMTFGVIGKSVTWKETAKLFLVCYLGNLAGSILLAFLFWKAGLSTGEVGEFIANTAAKKMNLDFQTLFIRGILCNILVCLAVWCGYRCKSESGKLIMIFWCLFAFITCGFEHSVANMTLLTIGLLEPYEAAVSIQGYMNNLIGVTLGNMVGGILFVAIPYYMISKKKEVV